MPPRREVVDPPLAERPKRGLLISPAFAPGGVRTDGSPRRRLSVAPARACLIGLFTGLRLGDAVRLKWSAFRDAGGIGVFLTH